MYLDNLHDNKRSSSTQRCLLISPFIFQRVTGTAYWTVAAPALALAAALLAVMASSLATLSNLAHPM